MFSVYSFPSGAPSLHGRSSLPGEAVDLALAAVKLYGFAVVSSRHGSAAFILDTETGELVMTGNSDALCAASSMVVAEAGEADL